MFVTKKHFSISLASIFAELYRRITQVKDASMSATEGLAARVEGLENELLRRDIYAATGTTYLTKDTDRNLLIEYLNEARRRGFFEPDSCFSIDYGITYMKFRPTANVNDFKFDNILGYTLTIPCCTLDGDIPSEVRIYNVICGRGNDGWLYVEKVSDVRERLMKAKMDQEKEKKDGKL